MSKERIQNLLKQLCVNLYEREEVMALTLLSAIAGESIFLLGKPGVAKSLIARKLKYAFKDAKSFEYLMNRFSTPDEIFGPVSISKLKDHDKYERITENYLPKSDIVFLDEIWKASPSIQNTLLTVLNEKVYKNGEKEEKLPLKAIISASNELPEPNQGLSALWDRFILRFIVEGISDKDNFFKMIAEDVDINHDPVNLDLKISSEDYKVWQESIKKVVIPKEVFDVILYIKTSIDKQNEKNSKESEEIYISDRRWKKAIKILKTSAFLNGRIEVDLMDCFLLKHILWDMPEQIEFFEELIATAVKEYGYKEQVNLSEYEKLINDFDEEVKYEMMGEEKVSITQENNTIYIILETPVQDYSGYLYVFLDEKENKIRTKDLNKELEIRNTKRKNNVITLEYTDRGYGWRSAASIIKDNTLNTSLKIPTRQPHSLLINEWNKKTDEYLKLLDKEIVKLENISKTKIDKTHSFTSKKNIEYVEYNLANLKKLITNLQYNLKEIKHTYENIPANKIHELSFTVKEKDIENFRKLEKMNKSEITSLAKEMIKKGFAQFIYLLKSEKLKYNDIYLILKDYYKCL